RPSADPSRQPLRHPHKEEEKEEANQRQEIPRQRKEIKKREETRQREKVAFLKVFILSGGCTIAAVKPCQANNPLKQHKIKGITSADQFLSIRYN
ncbi:MAG TPA: hypothetical protein VK596_07560, partial [Edaphobacter sp.]|nr:hypothetical protein [Edaphobacter sp.]